MTNPTLTPDDLDARPMTDTTLTAELAEIVAEARVQCAHPNVHFHYTDGARVMGTLADAVERMARSSTSSGDVAGGVIGIAEAHQIAIDAIKQVPGYGDLTVNETGRDDDWRFRARLARSEALSSAHARLNLAFSALSTPALAPQPSSETVGDTVTLRAGDMFGTLMAAYARGVEWVSENGIDSGGGRKAAYDYADKTVSAMDRNPLPSSASVGGVSEYLLTKLIDTIYDQLIEAEVDYPAGRQAGHNITFDDAEMRAALRKALSPPPKAATTAKVGGDNRRDG